MGEASRTNVPTAHVKNLLQSARKPAVEGYTKIVTRIKEGGIATRVYKSSNGTVATTGVTWLCLQCPNVSGSREQHNKKHAFCELNAPHAPATMRQQLTTFL